MSKYKYVIIVALLVIFAVLLAVFKKDENLVFVSETITTVLDEVGIKYDENDYVTNDKQVKIYLFRGSGCSHCYEFLEFVNDELIKKYKNKVTFVIFETWNNKDNSKLVKKIGEFFNDDTSGVPYIIIGDKRWSGFASYMKDEMKEKIDEQYALEVEDRYDVMKEMYKE